MEITNAILQYNLICLLTAKISLCRFMVYVYHG